MSDTDNWPLLRAYLTGKGWSNGRRAMHMPTEEISWCAFLYEDSSPMEFWNAATMSTLENGPQFTPDKENEAIAWARANLGREQ